MKFPERLIGSIASQAGVSEHTIRLALGFKFRASKGMSLDAARIELGSLRPRNFAEDHRPYSRGYAQSIARKFGINFPDYEPANPLNLPLE